MSDDNSLQAPSPEQLAEFLPQYGIESFIAQGGMGAVYKGRQISLDRDVAIKVLLNEFGQDAEFLESFSTEAKAMARLNHPNLLGVFDFGDLDGMPYIVMEYVDGGSLHEAAWDQAIEPSAAVAIVKGICDGLANAHEHGIVHRDIKPSNILLTTSIEPKIADFGLAHAADSDQPGLVMGTPGYTAPEVFHDPDQAGKLADIYSVGVILHQLLTGADPAGSMEPPKQPSGNIRLDAIWRKATHISPAQRYQTVAEMSADLGKWSPSKLASPAAGGAGAYRPTKVKSSGGGIIGKLFIIAILAAVVYFVHHRLEDTKRQIKQVNDDTNKNVKVRVIDLKPDPIEKTAPETTDTTNQLNPSPIPEVDSLAPEPTEELLPGDLELRDRAIGLILDAGIKRDKELATSGQAAAQSIGARYRAQLTRIRNSYVSRLESAASETSDEDLKKRLLAQAKRAEDLDEWVGLLSADTSGNTNAGSNSFAGKWVQNCEGKDSQWIAHPDGRMEIVGKDWEVTWEILENGTLEVDWNKKRPYIYSRDEEGKGWTGETSFGKHTTLSPGDW